MEQPALRPKVSIVVITYQQVGYIGQCLDGILMQRTAFPVQILIGDDGSTDGTREICIRYAREHPDKVKLLLREQAERNPAHPPGRDNLLALLNAAEGEYIARCDGDDFWTDPEKLQRQVEHLDAHPLHAGCFHLVMAKIEETGEVVRTYGDHKDKLHFTVEDTLTVRSLCHPSGFMYRHTALPLFPDWLGKVISADIAMYSLVAARGVLYCIPEVMGIYRLHAGGITASLSHRGSRFHRSRIALWLHIDGHLGYRYDRPCKQLVRFHWRHILRQNTPRPRAKLLRSIIREVPSWFLRNPLFTLQLWREVVTGKARRLNRDLIPYPYIAVATSGRDTWNATFIAAHRKFLREVELVLCGEDGPTDLDNGKPILASTPFQRRLDAWEQRIRGWSGAQLMQARTVTLLKKGKIEMVLAEYGGTSGAMRSICKKMNIPLVVHYHGTTTDLANSGGSIDQASAWIAVGHHAEQQLLAQDVPRDKVYLISNETDMAALQTALEQIVEKHRKARS